MITLLTPSSLLSTLLLICIVCHISETGRELEDSADVLRNNSALLGKSFNVSICCSSLLTFDYKVNVPFCDLMTIKSSFETLVENTK